MQTQTATQAPTVAEAMFRQIGADFYAKGRPLADCLTTWERAGYKAALCAEADRETAAYLAQKGSRR